MESYVAVGQLIYLNTDKGEIRLKDRNYQTSQTLDLDEDMKRLPRNVWERLMGRDVEAVVIDDKASSVYDVNEEE